MNTLYMLQHPITNEVKYIGVTEVPLRLRLNRHISAARFKDKTDTHKWINGLLREGLRPIIVAIDICEEGEWEFWEQHYISLYHSWGFDLTNMTKGGYTREDLGEEWSRKASKIHKGKVLSEETKKKISLSLIGKSHTEDQKRKISESTRKVLRSRGLGVEQYDMNNNFIKEYGSIVEAVEQTGTPQSSLSFCLAGVYKSAGGFKWKRKINNLNSSICQ